MQICNYNCPGQLVIGGEKAAVDKAAALAKEAGCPPLYSAEGQRSLPQKADGSRRGCAGTALCGRKNFGTMETPVLFNCLGHEKKAETDSIPELLVRQVQSSVYMEDTLRPLG